MSTRRADIASQIRQAQTPAEELRVILSRLEAEVGKLGFSGHDRSADVLTLLDRAAELIEGLAHYGGDFAAEQARFDTITRQLESKGKAFLAQVGGPAALQALREEMRPPINNWWWTIDERLAKERRARQQRTLWTVGVAAVVFAALAGLYTLFLAPDETTRARLRHEQQAETALMQGDLPLALAEVEQALSYAPGDGNLLILRGVMLELMAQSGQADKDFDDARAAIGDPEAFYSARAQAYLIAGSADRALTDTQRMIEDNPDSAIGYFQMGNVNASLGNLLDASENYERASQLAAAAGQTELEALARVQLANLMLMLSAPQIPTATPLP
jgi:tetratricopeptide (TPR) repeat protein